MHHDPKDTSGASVRAPRTPVDPMSPLELSRWSITGKREPLKLQFNTKPEGSQGRRAVNSSLIWVGDQGSTETCSALRSQGSVTDASFVMAQEELQRHRDYIRRGTFSNISLSICVNIKI